MQLFYNFFFQNAKLHILIYKEVYHVTKEKRLARNNLGIVAPPAAPAPPHVQPANLTLTIVPEVHSTDEVSILAKGSMHYVRLIGSIQPTANLRQVKSKISQSSAHLSFRSHFSII